MKLLGLNLSRSLLTKRTRRFSRWHEISHRAPSHSDTFYFVVFLTLGDLAGLISLTESFKPMNKLKFYHRSERVMVMRQEISCFISKWDRPGSYLLKFNIFLWYFLIQQIFINNWNINYLDVELLTTRNTPRSYVTVGQIGLKVISISGVMSTLKLWLIFSNRSSILFFS